jgi:uncharacterized membrane protein YphA (DoxX/SURF4 family)
VAGAATPSRPSSIDAVLALAGDATPALAATRLQWLRRVVLTWSAVRTLVWIDHDAPLDPTLLGGTALVLAVAAALAFTSRWDTWASRVALPALLVQLIATVPHTPNHFFLEVYAVAMLACASGAPGDDALVLSGVRWLTALVLLLTGCQKLAFGRYVHADFLAFMVGRGDRFADLFAWVLPPTEVARLQAYDPFRGGAGPYRVTSVPFVLLSNVVWVAELALPIGLLLGRTRRITAVVALAFVALIQLGARELGFALLFTNLLVLFAPLALARIVAGGSLAMLTAIAAAALGLVPGSGLVRAWHLW